MSDIREKSDASMRVRTHANEYGHSRTRMWPRNTRRGLRDDHDGNGKWKRTRGDNPPRSERFRRVLHFSFLSSFCASYALAKQIRWLNVRCVPQETGIPWKAFRLMGTSFVHATNVREIPYTWLEITLPNSLSPSIVLENPMHYFFPKNLSNFNTFVTSFERFSIVRSFWEKERGRFSRIN